MTKPAPKTPPPRGATRPTKPKGLLGRSVGDVLVDGIGLLLGSKQADGGYGKPLLLVLADLVDDRTTLKIPCKPCEAAVGEACGLGKRGKMFFCWERRALAHPSVQLPAIVAGKERER